MRWPNIQNKPKNRKPPWAPKSNGPPWVIQIGSDRCETHAPTEEKAINNAVWRYSRERGVGVGLVWHWINNGELRCETIKEGE